MEGRIVNRAQLIDALRLAAELEHQLMCQYLFAAYSLKRYPYETRDPKQPMTEAQLERVRRFASKITLVARQEMEHLGLALNLLSAIGGTPSFSRPDMPQPLLYYGKAGIKMELTRADLATIERFQRFESPDEVSKGLPPGDAVKQQKALEFCDMLKNEPEALSDRFGASSGKLMASAPHIDIVHGIEFRSIQELYEDIADGFRFVSQNLGECNLFVGNPANQLYGGPSIPQYGTMNDLNQYGVDLIGVSDLQTALQAITMITEQGEGIGVPDSYLPNAHFCIFTQIREEMKKEKLGEIAARAVVRNPMTALQPGVEESEVNVITDEDTLAVARLFNECYEVMLLLLLYLYSDQVKTKEQTNGLMDTAFFPFMTMFVRPLAEILTELPAFEDKPGNAGPGFELAGDVVLFPDLPQTWTLFQERIDTLVIAFQRLTARMEPGVTDPDTKEPRAARNGWVPVHDPWVDLPGHQHPEVEADRRAMWDRLKAEAATLQPVEAVVQKERKASISEKKAKAIVPSMVWLRLFYLRNNMERISADWAANWLNVGRSE